MAKKYLRLNSGAFAEEEATVASTGVSDAGKIIALDANGRLDNSVLPVGVGLDTKTLEASESISAANLVNIFTSSGQAKIRKADASSAGKEANGYVLTSVTSGQNGLVYFEQIITGLSGLTPGATYFLSTTPGEVTATPPSGSGNIVQEIGKAISETELQFMPRPPVTLA